jgi:uncharacterized membrane protein
MFSCLSFGYGYWWIFPLVMIAMMVLCFFMMRGHGGAMMCSGCRGEKASDGSRDILNRKYDEGKKEDIARRTQRSPEKNRKEVASNEH